MTTTNLFKALSHCGPSKCENYLTESFVHAPRVLEASARDAFFEIIRGLSGLDSVSGLSQDVSILIHTQTSLREGGLDYPSRHVLRTVLP